MPKVNKKPKKKLTDKTDKLRKILKKSDPLAQDLSFLLDDMSQWVNVRFEMRPKDKTITLRMSEDLLLAIKAQAKKQGIDYQKWIRAKLAAALKAS